MPLWHITRMTEHTPSERSVSEQFDASDQPYRFDSNGALLETSLPFPRRSGKVRDVYDLGDSLWIVSTDRISAFDHVLPCGIPDKGKLLTAMSRFWFDRLGVPNHLIDTEVPAEWSGRFDTGPLEGRGMRVHKADVVPFECVVRGYLEGSGLREYQTTGEVCGVRLPAGLRPCDRLPEPIFTPATKAVEGHDENVRFERLVQDLGESTAMGLRTLSLEIYRAATDWASSRGILIADTKFEFGWRDGELILIDEVLTPDSSRFWDAGVYQPGHPQPSFDKQFVREWLTASDWDRESPPPRLPDAIVEQTAAKYAEAYRRLVD